MGDYIEEQFSRKTSIVNKTDLSFLAIATALQVAKSLVFPYIAEKFDYGKSFDPSERLNHNDKSIENAHREANNKFRDKRIEKHGTGNWINILYQTVPYDITKGSKDLGINMGGKYHRMYTLGHDPILGWIFGTANILTDCITFNNFHTNRISRIDPITGAKKMVITPETVFLGRMFSECYDEVKADPLNLPAALFAQAQHLKSDEFTKLGLPVPILSSITDNIIVDYITGADGVLAGTTAYDSMMPTVVNELAGYENDPVIVSAMREAAHHNLYALANSAAMNGVGENTTVKITEYYLVTVLRTLAIVFGVFAIPSAVMWSRGKKLKATETYGAYKAK